MNQSRTTWLRRTATIGVLATAGLASPAFAQQDTENLAVSATVSENCVVATSPVAFGSVDVTLNANSDSTGGISVTCTSGTAWTATADDGAAPAGTLAVRQMASGINLLNYALYTDSARTSVWGDGVGGTTGTITGTGTGTADEHIVYARVPSGQTTAPAGSYTDTVVVTVTY